ncbi:MAG: DegT/DnrJ/EryC1/StrS family aminotransferase [Hymenobacter sp.]
MDFAGLAVDMAAARALADEFGLWLIEDACHAPGGFFIDGQGIEQQCGSGQLADLAIFSFHPVKHIATGEGGMVTTNDEALYAAPAPAAHPRHRARSHWLITSGRGRLVYGNAGA